MNLSKAVRTVALIEAAKGLVVVMAGIGAFSLLHHNAQQIAESLVGHLHLNPAKEFPRIFVEYAAKLSDSRLAVLSALAALYSMGRFIEAYGLWLNRQWAEWFAIITGVFYIPFELYALLYEREWLAVWALALNLGIVLLMVSALVQKTSSNKKHAT